jgi:hypothetical protein
MQGLDWQVLGGEVGNLGELQPALSIACFSLGILGVAMILRRMWQRNRGSTRDALCYNTRSARAHVEIDAITVRQWLRHYQRARRIPHRATGLDAEQCALLNRLSELQAERRAH